MKPSWFPGPKMQRVIPISILAMGIALSFFVAWEARNAENQRTRSVFELGIEWRARDIEDKIRAAATPVEALADFVPSQIALDPGEFHRFAIQARRDSPVSRLAWAQLVKAGDRAQFEAAARQSGLSGYAISAYDADGVLHPEATRDEYLPTRLAQQLEGSPSPVGFDLLSDKTRADIVDDARDRGIPIAAPPLLALSRPNNIPNYIVFWPVYSTQIVPETQEARRAAFRGVVIGVFPINDMMKYVARNTHGILGTLNLFIDQPPGVAYGAPMAIYHPDSGQVVLPSAPLGAPPAGGLRLSRSFFLFGHTWTLVTDYPPSIVGQARTSDEWVYLVLGILMTFGVTAYVESEQRGRSRVEAEVVARTRDLQLSGEVLRRTTEQMKAVIDASPVAIFAFDADRRLTVWSGAAEALFGYAAEEVLGGSLPPEIFIDDDDSADKFRLAAEGAYLRGVETRLRNKEGAVIEATVSVAPVVDAGGIVRGTVLAVSDITERNLMQRQLQQAQKMEAIGQLTGGMAHDFNNLLAVVIGNLDLLQEDQVPGSDNWELAAAAIHAAERGAELTKQLLAFARQQPLAPRLTNLSGVLDGLVRLLRRTLGEQISLDLDISDSLWPVLIDPSQLESAILNLAVNARDAMEDGGRLTLEARNVTLDEGAAELNPEAAPGHYVAFAISDTGSGMPPEVVQRAFDPFFSTKGGKGTGLGLSMVHGFVKQSGGHTRIYSEMGRGTTIRLYLPRADEAGVEADQPTGDSGVATGNELILIVEDNDGLRELAERQIQSFGYRTITAANAADALEVIRDETLVNLLFTDVVMPGGMDGRSLAETARGLNPQIKVLFTSGFTAAAASAAMSEEFGVNLLSKPYRREELARRIRTAIDGVAE